MQKHARYTGTGLGFALTSEKNNRNDIQGVEKSKASFANI